MRRNTFRRDHVHVCIDVSFDAYGDACVDASLDAYGDGDARSVVDDLLDDFGSCGLQILPTTPL